MTKIESTTDIATRIAWARAVIHPDHPWHHRGLVSALQQANTGDLAQLERTALRCAVATRPDGRPVIDKPSVSAFTHGPLEGLTTRTAAPAVETVDCPEHDRQRIRLDGSCAACWADRHGSDEPYQPRERQPTGGPARCREVLATVRQEGDRG